MREQLSSRLHSVDDQIADVVSWLSNDPRYADVMEHHFLTEFPEYNHLVWDGSRVDAEASGVDSDYMHHVADWIETNTLVYWEDGCPWIGSDDEGDWDDE
jgi:hypothetical protein